MRLYLSVRTNIKEVYIDVLEIELANGTEFAIDCDETFYDRNPHEEKLDIEMRGLSHFDEETVYLNGQGDLFKNCRFKVCQLYSESRFTDVAYFAVEKVILEDGEARYELPRECVMEMRIYNEIGNEICEVNSADIPWEFTAPDEMKLMYILPDDSEMKKRLIGILRGDFGKSGKEFYSTWFDVHTELKTDGFRNALEQVIDYFRYSTKFGFLRAFKIMADFCRQSDSNFVFSKEHKDNRGIKVKRENYSFYLRLNPHINDYHFYCFCYDESKDNTESEMQLPPVDEHKNMR